MNKVIYAKPFVKWVGGKSQMLDEIRRMYPVGFGSSITKYAEPFIGGGAVLFDILANYTVTIGNQAYHVAMTFHIYRLVKREKYVTRML
jgi:site-specific DNA-adenine methylase